jgi:predicted pyridoxine 5'-phosphate oxidase superfamily flavin-nucleotide-binding protein
MLSRGDLAWACHARPGEAEEDVTAMAESVMYHEGNRQLQDRFDSRRISDRLEEKLMRKEFSADDKQFIESLPYFFLATADAKGRPDCSFKGGAPGFVRITGPSEIAFPDYDGNGMFKSLGNIVANADVGLLFIAMHDKPRRLRVNGRASVSDNDPLLAETVGAQLIVRVTARAIFPNCPRYIPTMSSIEPSIYVPIARQEAPEPAWKGFADFKDCIHPRQPTFKG